MDERKQKILESITESTDEIIWSISWPDGKILYVSPSVEEKLGFPPSYFYSHPSGFHHIIYPEDLHLEKEAVETLKEKGSVHQEFRVICKDGSVIWVESHSKLVKDGSEFRLDGIFYDISERKRLELQLASKESFLQQVIDMVPSILFVKNQEDQFVIVNQAVADWYRKTSGELIGKRDIDLFHDKEEAKRFSQRDQEIIATQQEFVGEPEKTIRPDGIARWLNPTLRPITSDSGEVFVLGLCTDVTALKDAEERLVKQNRFKDLLLHLANQLIRAPFSKIDNLIGDAIRRIGQYIQADRGYIDEYHFQEGIVKNAFEWCAEGIAPRKDTIQRYPLSHMQIWLDLHLDGREAFCPDVSQMEPGVLKSTLESSDIKTILTVPLSGTTKCYGSIGFDHIRSVHDYSQEELHLLRLFASMLVQVYESKEKEEEVQAYRQRIDYLLKEIPASIWSISYPDFANMYFSPSSEKLYGRPISEIAGNPEIDFEFTHPDDKEKCREAFDGVEAKGNAEVEYRLFRPDNSIIWVNSKLNAVYEKGKLVRIQGIDIDITSQKETETLLVQARKMAESASNAKSQFLANMSHELRTPLTGIIGFADSLKETDLTEEQHYLLSHIVTAAHALKNLVGDILDISKIEAGKLELFPRKTNLNTVARQTLSMVQYQADQKGLKLELKLDPKMPEIYVDALRLQQVLLNLLSNAVKFTDSGQVTLEVKRLPGHPLGLNFEVTDTGIGISQEDQQLIFQVFEQADSSPTRRFGGSGLGLTLSSELIHLMGSTIQVRSEPGAGSAFFFTIYPPKAPDEAVQRKATIPISHKPFTILIVDNSPVNTVIIKSQTLKILPNATLIEASNGKEALTLFSSEIDLVFMDLLMPEMDGWEATQLIRHTHPKVPIIAITAAVDDQSVERAFLAGVSDYLIKPFSLDDLALIIEKFV